ncbi:MAG: hypothetical protein AB7L09_02360 [Nitrospira sp.]
MSTSTTVRDFLHQPINHGDYIVRMGGGNRSAEYGMILYQITNIAKGKITTKRLSVKYRWYEPDGSRRENAAVEVSSTVVRISKTTSIVKVIPHANQVKVFSTPEDYPELVGAWLHGQDIDWDSVL